MALALTALLVPATAHAITVECSNAFGSCEISNDGDDEVFCECDNGGTGSTGGNDWTGLNEAELLLVCFDHLEFCGPIAETDFGTTGTTTFGTDTMGDTSFGVTTDPTETESESATTSATEGTTFESESMTTIDPSATDSDHSTSDPTIDPTDSGSTSGDTEGSSTGDGTTGDDPSTSTDPTTGDPSAVTMSGTETAPVETSDAESSGDTTGGSDGEGGCSCSADGTGSPFAAFGLLALLGLRRRRR